MTKIVVTFDEMSKYSSSLIEKNERLANTEKELREIVNSLSNCWHGPDSVSFISTANKYLDNLKPIEKSLGEVCASVNTNNKSYIERCSKFSSLLGG